MIENSLILMVGVTGSGKTKYVEDNYSDCQVITEKNLIKAIKKEGLPNDPKFLYSLMAVIARQHMISGFPIVVDANNIDLESIFIWKEYADMYNYKLKLIVMKPKFPNPELKATDNDLLEDCKFKELIQVFNLEHHKLYDNIIYVTEDK